ncbi:uncharacterized protein N7496_012183 [Penicillium cataractarum]|uniref:Zn(2)-C6 fungal-type domain-containing protein n=1 Tax=Penicillium cataractarum TaxID=2100454 RepID=A0A9W9UU96_9EURO|nr:uncharacterized protein N7496_012183 [Penicillium cataractarum]KAJ5354971.1 hypothetical protein N7496_012183 [Penicillium cataractarum]
MVGVPRSKGCLACVRRRIKCDERRPGCDRCEKKGSSCPGYTRDLKINFYTNPRAVGSYKAGIESTPDQHPHVFAGGSSIDGAVAPSLASVAIAEQYREAFCGFVEANFLGLFYGYSTRVGTNWFDVVHNYRDTAGKALDLCLRSLGALHIGRSLGDDRLGLASREMYGQALNHLARTLRNPALATADNTLGAAILLGVYELTSSTGQESWMLHSRGISNLYQIRGPQAHADGLGRTLLLSFRGFLVYEALTRGEKCFLEGEEWRSIIPDMINEERRRGKFSRLGELIEYSFHEIARCPGFLASARALIASADTTDCEREDLMTSVSHCQGVLLEHYSELIAGLNASRWPTTIQTREFFGPIPFQVREALAEFSLQGITSAIQILQQLLVKLRSNDPRRIEMFDPNNQQKEARWENLDYPPGLNLTSGRRHLQLPRATECETPYTWPDQLSMSMGMPIDTL